MDNNTNNKNNYPKKNSRKENDGPRENENVKRFIKDPNQLSTDTTVLYGYVGSSGSTEITRLYTDISFKEYYEINKNDIKDWKENPEEKDPFGGTFIFVDSDAEIKVVRIQVAKVRARFLVGMISRKVRRERRRLRRRAEGPFYTAPSACANCGYQFDVVYTELQTRCVTCGETCDGPGCPPDIIPPWDTAGPTCRETCYHATCITCNETCWTCEDC